MRRIWKIYKQKEPIDGSYHDWFEGRHQRCWLMAMVDDAANTVYAQFTGPESLKPAMQTVWACLERYGCSRMLYCDRKNCCVTQEMQSIEEQLENKPHCTGFTRASHELGITVLTNTNLILRRYRLHKRDISMVA